MKHSGASRACIKITHEDKYIYVEGQDNGTGMKVNMHSTGIGPKTIQDRVQQLIIESNPGKAR